MNKRSVSFDVFVSYALEDMLFAQQLVSALIAKGLSVWFDKGNLRIEGPALHQIENGLERSKHFLLIVSSNYFKRAAWPPFEVGVALSRVPASRILVVYLEDVPHSELQKFAPVLAEKAGVSAKDHSIEEIATTISNSLTKNSSQ